MRIQRQRLSSVDHIFDAFDHKCNLLLLTDNKLCLVAWRIFLWLGESKIIEGDNDKRFQKIKSPD